MTDEQHNEHPALDPTEATRDWIDLKFTTFRSEMRMLFVLSVAGNQLLAHIALAPALGYIANVGLIIGVVALKIGLLR
jgi:hypothetical protein